MRRRNDSHNFWGTIGNMLFNILIEELFCLIILTLLGSALESKTGQYVGYVIMLLVFTILTYLELWKYGAGDRNLAAFGRMNRDYLRGFKLGLAAGIPFFIYNLYFAVLTYTQVVTNSVPLGFLRFLNAHMMIVINSIYTIDKDFSVTPLASNLYQALIIFLMPLFIALISGIAYFLGFRDFSIISKTMYKKIKQQ